MLNRDDTLFFNTTIYAIKDIVICKKYLQQTRKTVIRYCYKNMAKRCKNCFKKVVHKSAGATAEFLRETNLCKTCKTKPVFDKNLVDVEEIIISLEEREKILKELYKHYTNGTS